MPTKEDCDASGFVLWSNIDRVIWRGTLDANYGDLEIVRWCPIPPLPTEPVDDGFEKYWQSTGSKDVGDKSIARVAWNAALAQQGGEQSLGS